MAAGFLDILREATTIGEKDIRHVYSLLNIAMHRAVDQRVAGSRIHFGGLFAKTDYLVKEYHVDSSLAHALSNVRVRLKTLTTTDDATLQEYWKTDLEALARFICIIYDEPLPQDLLTATGAGTGNIKGLNATAKKSTKAPYLRMVVERWDEHNIYGQTEELGAVTVRYDLQTDEEAGLYYAGDWTYIRELLSEGCLLNIVKPRQKGDDETIYPELIVFQPDYLVDISSIAGCFTNYDDTPLAALLNRLRTSHPTKAIYMGHLASQMLDEEVRTTERKSYAEVASTFFHRNALDLAAATDIDRAAFHKEAQEQRENIHIAVREALEKEVGGFKAELALLEPSFFCEMLGMQGRMDLLQRDYRVLIEQKSGKGGFPQRDPDTPVYLETHYVQMLLYMAMLHYGYKLDGQPISNEHMQTFLLYSKYRNGLVRLGPAPQLLFKAFKLRNEIAWHEIQYATKGADILTTLNVDEMRRKQISDKFWTQWIKPQLEEVLQPIRGASPLERAYFLRMMRFVAMEHMLSKMGSNTKENSGFAAKWHDTLADKHMAGNIYDRLTLEPNVKDGIVEDITLRSAGMAESAEAANFRRGDIVVIYAYEGHSEPDIRQTVVHRGSIKDIFIDDDVLTVTIRLRAPQSDPTVFDTRTGWYWAVEHDFFESSSTTQFRSIHQFLGAPTHRKSLILTKRMPEVDESIALKGDYGNFNELVRRATQAKDIFIVIGPPGTGKTSFGLLNILREHLRQDATANVLLMAYTNRAVDEICSKLTHPDDGGEPMDYIRIGSSLSCDPAYKEHLLEERSKDCKNITELRQLISGTHLMVGTTTRLTGEASSLFTLKTFSLAIIDEASQILEPHLLGLLSATDGIDVAISKFVLIGDHKQLPAVVQQSDEESQVTEPLLNEIGLKNCRSSLFERLLTRYGDDPRYSYMLQHQGRMHPVIADFPNTSFYDGKLDVVPLPHQSEESKDKRVTFIAVEKPLHSASDKVNENEAKVIAKVVYDTYVKNKEHFDTLKTVGVIVPYRNQITAVRHAIDSYGVKILHDITIDTVERYQGSQRDTIIYGFTVQYPYQLNFLTANTFTDAITGAMIDRKLNVALTRARKNEVIVGNPEVLRYNDIFRRLIEKYS